MGDVLLILLAVLAAFIANAAPAFMPANWIVLAAFRLLGLPLIPLGLAGAVGAAAGRASLAAGARYGSRWLPSSQTANVEALGGRLARLRRSRTPFLAAYSVSPLPSNVLFIAIGAGGLNILRAAVVFFACRAVTDTFWMWFSTTAGESATRMVINGWFTWRSLLLQLASLVAVIALFRLPLSRWLGGEQR